MSFFNSNSSFDFENHIDEISDSSEELFTSQDLAFNQFSQQSSQNLKTTVQRSQTNLFPGEISNFQESQFFKSSQNLETTTQSQFILNTSANYPLQIQDETNFFINNSQAVIDDDDDDDDDEIDELMNVEETPKIPRIDVLTKSSILTIDDDNVDFNSEVPESVVKLYKDVKEHFSDWTYVSLIAGQLCSEIFPMGVYLNLKIALLMSLVSSTPLHIITIGSETQHANTIMNYLGKFSQRFQNGSLNSDGVTVKKSGEIEAGPMSLATHGVTFIGNWQRLSPKIILKYLREIETGNMTIDKIQKNFPLQTTIWAYWSGSSNIKKDIASIEQFLNVFGIPIIFDDKLNEDFIANDLLDQVSTDPSDRTNDFNIPENDLHHYLNYAKNLTVKFDARSEVMLRNYFISTKTIRHDTLTEKAYDVLKNFAEAHAKLCLRRVVMRQDILASIAICEKFIKLLFDTDSYSSPNESKVTSIDHYDAYMNELFKWYSSFTNDIMEKM